MDPRARNELTETYRRTRLIGVAMIAALFFYALIVEMIKRSQVPFEGFARFSGWEVLRYIFLAMAVLNALVVRVVTNVIRSGAARFSAALPLEARPRTAAVVSYAVWCESVALYGFVLFVIAGSSFDFYLFLSLSVVLFGIYFPRYEQWEAWARKG